MRTTLYNLLLLLALVLCFSRLAFADESDRASFYLRDLRPAFRAFDNVSPYGLDQGSNSPPTLNSDNYTFDMNPGELMSLRRSFNRSLIDTNTNSLRVAFQEETRTEGALTLGGGLGLSFASVETEVKSPFGLALSSSRSTIMGLNQSFGGGESASALSLKRTETTSSALYGQPNITTRLETLNFKSGINARHDLVLAASRSESDAVGNPTESSLAATFTTRFSGGDGPISFLRNEKTVGGIATLTEKFDLAMPFAANGGKGILEHHSLLNETGPTRLETRTSHFKLPMRLFGQTGVADYLVVREDKGAGVNESRTAKLVNPFKIGGKTFALEESFVTLEQPTQTTETFTTALTAPIKGVPLSLQRQTTTVTTPTAESERERLAVVLPTFNLSQKVAVSGQRVTTDISDAPDQDLTDVSVAVTPTKFWQLQAKQTTDDKGPTATTETRQLVSKFALGSKLSLEGRLTESEAPGVESSLKMVELTRDKGNSGVGLRAGFVAYDNTLNQDQDPARRVELTAGKPGSLAISAAYSEYDPNSFTRYADDQTVALSVSHGDPSDLAVRWRYEDQPTRVEPLRAIDLATGVLGSTLQVSYQSNPATPDGKLVRQADQYDASLARRLFSDVNLKLGFRYLDYSTVDLVDQHYRIQMDGGNEARGGKVALSYYTGDFCTPDTTTQLIPSSTLDLTFSRLWGDTGKLKLSVQRQTAPTGTAIEDKTEGLLEYSRVF